ncbi:MAG: class I SAM-dependent methyltransferase [Candidatus Woesearchaeota archaeon]
MPENRYDAKLRENNRIILELTRGNQVLRLELAFEIRKLIEKHKNPRILEIGSGEGDLTKYILQHNPTIKIDALDVSPEMIASSKKELSAFIDRINFICEDVSKYLQNIKKKYDVITEAWTIHNFKWEDKNTIFKQIHEALAEGGTFIMMDKLYPDNPDQQEELLTTQLRRYEYLDVELRKEITDHELQDYREEFKMEETQTIDILKEIGFKNIRIVDRSDRDVVLIASK